MRYIIGQAFGLLASGISLMNPIYRKKWMMLLNNLFTNLFYGLNLVFLDEIGSGVFLFAVAVLQAAINLVHSLRGKEPKLPEKLIFLVLYVGLGFYGLVTSPDFIPAVNQQNLVELLPIIGAVFSMCFVFTPKEQNARKFLLCCDSTWAVYYIIIGSTGVVGNLLSITLCLIAMYRYRQKKA